MPEVSVAIVNYNTCEILRACLQNLCKAQDTDEALVEVIVVDNASTDGSAQMVQEQFPAVRLIELPENRGLTAASNLALAEAQGDFVLYLGADAFPQRGVIDGMARFMQEYPDVGIATAKLVLRDGRLDWDAHRGFPTPWAALTHFTGLNRLFPRSKIFNQYFLGHKDLASPHEIDLCISHFMFVRKEIFTVIGSWDEDFFLYGEDVDLCYRVKAAGYKIMFLPQFEVLHYKGASVGIRQQTQDISTASPETKARAAQLSTRAMELFYTKHLAQQYPRFVSIAVLMAIRLLSAIRLQKALRTSGITAH
jgi:GT2 family glycosyltransferase